MTSSEQLETTSTQVPEPSLIKSISSSYYYYICLQFENVVLYAAILTLGEIVSCLRDHDGQAILTSKNSSIPTKDQVLVPETLLKKRKSQEQARAERRAESDKKKQVGFSTL